MPKALAKTAKLTWGLPCQTVVAAREPVKPSAITKKTKLMDLKMVSPIANIGRNYGMGEKVEKRKGGKTYI